MCGNIRIDPAWAPFNLTSYVTDRAIALRFGRRIGRLRSDPLAIATGFLTAYATGYWQYRSPLQRPVRPASWWSLWDTQTPEYS